MDRFRCNNNRHMENSGSFLCLSKLIDSKAGAGIFLFQSVIVLSPEIAARWALECLQPEFGQNGKDIFENEGRLMNLYKDETFKARKAYYTAVCEPTPPPSKG